MRLDLFLSENNFAETRTRAKNLIELGRVTVNDTVCLKPSYSVTESDKICITEDYHASLGGLKLEKAFADFQPNIDNKVCLDLGAANGGFTEILLNNSAGTVYALDIGVCALPARLIADKRVKVMEKTNARYIKKNDFDNNIDFISGDLSFISLKYILPVAYAILEYGGTAVFLIKPQFELNKKLLPKSGIVKDEKTRLKIVNDIKKFATELGFSGIKTTEAPHPFIDKNQEYLLYLEKNRQ